MNRDVQAPAAAGSDDAGAGWRRVLPFVAYVGLVFLVAGATAHPLYRLASAAGLSPAPFHEFTFRALELWALAGLVPLLRHLGLEGRGAWGYAGTSRGLAVGLGSGLLLGLASLGAVAVALLALGVRVPIPSFDWTAAAAADLVAGGLVAGVLISLVEETWYRGALQSALTRRYRPATAIVVIAGLFAATHFIRPDVPVDGSAARWWSGFTVIGDLFHRFEDPGIADSFLGLFAAGAWLGLIRRRTGAVAACIGVHTGWVVVIRLLRKTTVLAPDSPWSFAVGGYDGVVGVLAAVVLAGFAWLSYRRWEP